MGRREAREVSLQAIYASDMTGKDVSTTSDFALSLTPLSPRDREFMLLLSRGAMDRKAELDTLIGAYARGWRLERISHVDRCILRLALYELSGGSDAPVEVIINEAVELAKKYSGERSHRFINGILGKIVADRVFVKEDKGGFSNG